MSAEDYGSLAERILGFAVRAIAKDGYLLPIGAVVKDDGTVVPVTPTEPTPESTADSLRDDLLDELRGLAASGDVRAAAYCLDMKIDLPDGSTSDALILFFETASESFGIAHPYSGAGTTLKFGSRMKQLSPAMIFAT
jgi:hypothetical protein